MITANVKNWAEEENSCPFIWIFEINGLSLRSVIQHSNVGNTQQAGTRIQSCILSIPKNHICLCYEERKHSNATTAVTLSRPSISNGKQRYIPSRCPAPTAAAATLCQSPSSLLWRKGYTGRYGNKSTIINEKQTLRLRTKTNNYLP